jgi:hypothetical protein
MSENEHSGIEVFTEVFLVMRPNESARCRFFYGLPGEHCARIFF